MSCSVRRAREGDFKQLCVLWEQLDRMHADIQPDFFRWPPRPRPLGELRRALGDPHRELFVALVGSPRAAKVAGVVQLQLYDVSDQPMLIPGRRVYVEDLVVLESHRGTGIGRALMETAHDWAERQGARQVVLTVWEGNAAAFEFYREVGYRPINRVLVWEGS